MMPRYSNKILVILMFVFFPGLVPAQPRIQETRLMMKYKRGLHLNASGGLGSELFAYSRYDEKLPIMEIRNIGTKSTS